MQDVWEPSPRKAGKEAEESDGWRERKNLIVPVAAAEVAGKRWSSTR